MISSFLLPGESLKGVAVGVSDLKPRDQQVMTPCEFNDRKCGHVTREVGGGETVTLTCSPRGVTGQYLIVQKVVREDYLSLCEVEAGKAILMLIFSFLSLQQSSEHLRGIDVNKELNYINRHISLVIYRLVTLITCYFSIQYEVCAEVITSFSVGLPILNWTFVLPISNISDTTLHLVSDLPNATCAHLDLDDGDVHLRGQLTGTFNSLLVTLIMATSSAAFGPGPGQTSCHTTTSSLLTHQRSACNQTICAVPTVCSYTGNEAISTALWEYEFLCVCGHAICNELLLWLRPEEGQLNRVQFCEVTVGFVWFAW